jgi:MFS family permease
MASQITDTETMPTEIDDKSTLPDTEHDPSTAGPATANSGVEEKQSTMTIPPPDVGLIAWLQILGGFLLMFNAWGLVLAYGSFQAYYETPSAKHPPPFTASPSTAAWIGSIQAFLLLFMGGVCGRLFDAGYLRFLLLTGTGLIVVGLMLASLVHAYWQALLSQGVCVGLGMGCLLVPSVGTASTWFVKHRGMAVGIVTSGSAVGGIVLPIICQKLLPVVGFGWTLRILGFVSLVTLSISVAVLRPRLRPRKRGGFFAFSALKEGPFLCYCSGMLVALLGFYVFMQFVQSVCYTLRFSLDDMLTLPMQWAGATSISSFDPIYYLPIINAASAVGRFLPAFISDTVGPLNVQIPCAILSAVLAYAWLGVHALPSLLVICVLYGFFSGGMLALPPAAVASLTEDMTHFGQRMGMCFVFMAVGSLVGTPVTGTIIGSRNADGNWNGARIWAGTTILLGGFLMVASRWRVSRRKGKIWIKV